VGNLVIVRRMPVVKRLPFEPLGSTAFASCFRFNPRTNRERSWRSSDTEGSPASILATLDWLDASVLASVTWVIRISAARRLRANMVCDTSGPTGPTAGDGSIGGVQ
jgi:hypothetical protein